MHDYGGKLRCMHDYGGKCRRCSINWCSFFFPSFISRGIRQSLETKWRLHFAFFTSNNFLISNHYIHEILNEFIIKLDYINPGTFYAGDMMWCDFMQRTWFYAGNVMGCDFLQGMWWPCWGSLGRKLATTEMSTWVSIFRPNSSCTTLSSGRSVKMCNGVFRKVCKDVQCCHWKNHKTCTALTLERSVKMYKYNVTSRKVSEDV